ncbi:MAG TPA: head-tail joining protein [Ignavibacteriales bacterium]|nr:head-tail joining protein [Ignavibacteriales bacterium]
MPYDFVDEAFNSGMEEPAVLKATGKTIQVIFDNEVAVEQGQYFEIEAGRSVALCRTDDVSALKNEETITIRNKDYKIKAKKPDGTGFTTLILAVY